MAKEFEEILDTIFDPLCFAQVSTTGENIEDQFEVSDYIGSMPDLDQLPAAQIAHLYAHIKEQFDLMDAARDELSKFIELIKNVKLPAAFEREGVKTFTLEDGTRVTMTSRTFATIVGDQQDAFNWLRENGYPDVIKETVNASTLSSVAKEILSNVEMLPSGMLKPKDDSLPMDLPETLFKVEIRPSTSVTKGKGK